MLDVAECNINQIIVTRLNNLKKCSQASLPEYEIHFEAVVLTFRVSDTGLDSEHCLSMSMEKYL